MEQEIRKQSEEKQPETETREIPVEKLKDVVGGVSVEYIRKLMQKKD